MLPTAFDIRGAVHDDLRRWVVEHGWEPYRADQLFSWLHKKRVTSWSEMLNVPQAVRDELGSSCLLTTLDLDTTQASSDGTEKLRLRCGDGALIEAVLIPHEQRLTLCVSSQVGCALGCEFCATATMGLKRNLLPAEIVDQVYRAFTRLPAAERVSNIVFMGMGEPLANLDNVLAAVQILTNNRGSDFSSRRITISTAGIVPKIRELGQRMPEVGLAISLHATTDELRNRLMPINRRWSLEALFTVLREYPLPRRRRITFEYILLPGLNDSQEDIARLMKWLRGIRAKVNLLPYNPWRTDHPEFGRLTEDEMEDFADKLRAKDITATVRYSRGLDISAACGQLALSNQRE